ncbi:MAG TPA: hypothetical protein PLF70_00215 [Candidatus Portnoybacteria bacterium]|jgi:hypothetical protein|nr:hypothetical protein [Candidatus Portnoybacteria bacterium]MDD5751970.1 hypothetical protein [Candidatus Portnoybacteria bacterium]HNU96646.1 hypothetical protein [Candidatus Portnoybacteria bacterium]HOZ16226.1 hypothetical protein [Candidatus Portnoybacteria bacterium]HPH51979.1 hypothetical protein [Candidatus Portnoybacteria bacterium]
MNLNYQHKELANGRWNEFNFFQQMANVGSEVIRAINWRERNKEYSMMAVDRALELLDLTIQDKKNQQKYRLNELLRLREFLADYFYFDNVYKSTDVNFNNYFLAFNYAANI